MKQISAKYSKRESDLELTSQRVTEEMENNPDFQNPPAALAELKKVLPEFRTARVNAEGGDKKLVSIKNDKKAIVLALLLELAEYVTVISKGDRTLILSSGFDVSSDSRSGSNLPPSIEILEVELGPSGEATTRVKNVTGVKAYVHQYTTEPPGLNTVWIGEGSSQGIYTFQGLSSDKRYWFRVVIIGSNGQRGYSPVVTRVIQ
ncbi:MAG TPA: hypothetical protein VF008_13070 [Niastella sp.]